MIIGPSRSGKTHLLIEILYNFKLRKMAEKVVLFSPTAESDEIWKRAQKRMGTKLVDTYYDDVNPNTIAALKKMIKRKNKRKPIVVVIDDLGENTYISRSKKGNPFLDLSNASFQANIIYISLYQKYTQANPSLRENAEFIFGKKPRKLTLRKGFLEDFLGNLSEEARELVADQCWREKYDTMVIDRTDLYVKVKRLEENLTETEVYNEDEEVNGRKELYFHFYV